MKFSSLILLLAAAACLCPSNGQFVRTYSHSAILNPQLQVSFSWTMVGLPNPTAIRIGITANVGGYLSVGFSSSGTMSSLDCMMCYVDGSGNGILKDYYVNGHSTPSLDAVQNYIAVRVSRSGGVINCEFDRNISDSDSRDYQFNLQPSASTPIVWATHSSRIPSSPTSWTKHDAYGTTGVQLCPECGAPVPVRPPVSAPVRPPVRPPVIPPVSPPVRPPVQPPVSAPVRPVLSPVRPPVLPSVLSPVSPPVPAPVFAPVRAPAGIITPNGAPESAPTPLVSPNPAQTPTNPDLAPIQAIPAADFVDSAPTPLDYANPSDLSSSPVFFDPSIDGHIGLAEYPGQARFGSGLQFGLHWRVDAEKANIYVAMSAPGRGYIGFGLGSSMTMSDCVIGSLQPDLINNVDAFELKDYWSTGDFVPDEDTTLPGGENNILAFAGSYNASSNLLTFEFVRPIAASEASDQVIVLDQPIEIIWAWSEDDSSFGLPDHGPINRGSGKIFISSNNGASNPVRNENNSNTGASPNFSPVAPLDTNLFVGLVVGITVGVSLLVVIILFLKFRAYARKAASAGTNTR